MSERRTHEPVRTDAELRQRWQEVVASEPFDERTLWLIWFDAGGQMLPVVMPVDELPRHPHGQTLDGLRHVAASVLEDQAPGGSVAMLLSRAGPPSADACDRAWAQALGSLGATGLRMRPLHLATAGGVGPLGADDGLR